MLTYHPYPDNWTDIATSVKSGAGWRCQKCGLQCIRPGEDTSKLTRSQRMKRTLQTHPKGQKPRSETALKTSEAVCSACHRIVSRPVESRIFLRGSCRCGNGKENVLC